MTEYRKGVPADMPEIVDFGNYVFSQSHRPHDFKQLIPKVYADGHSENAAFHFLALEDGRIRGMIASYPQIFQVGGVSLDTRFIGTVSVHPYARGAGYMKQLMADAEKSFYEEKIDMAFLSGQRQRYGYFGFESGGNAVSFCISQANIKHAVGEADDRVVLMPVDAEDEPLLDAMYEIYKKNPVTCRSREIFFETLCTWKAKIYAVIADVVPCGYLVASEGGERIFEVCLSDASLLPQALGTYMRWYYDGDEISVRAATYETELLQVLSAIAEDVSIVDNLRYCIFNYEKVTQALFNLKASHCKLADGTLTIEIQDEARIQISVRDGIPTVRSSDADPDWLLTPKQFVQKITSTELWYLPEENVDLPKNWFPLSLSLSPLDEF